ncbi:MAG: cytochrome c oxidase subunit II [Candidatus Angelobacter sp.]
MKGTPKTFFLRKLGVFSSFVLCAAASQAQSNTSVFSWVSTPAHSITRLGYLVLAITGGLFFAISGLLVYAIIRYRARPRDEEVEPPQVFGSTEIELSWTIIPVLIIVVLFLTTAGVIFGLQDVTKPKNALEVTVVGHQFWWEFRYPQLGVTTANELHLPVSDLQRPRPSFMKLTSADVDHSFWVPQLAGKVDLLPNRVNELWTDPHQPGLYEGQCTMLCGVEHAKMLLRVYVDTPEQFEAWIQRQQRPAQTSDTAAEGRRIFEVNSCINCHTVAGTVAKGRFGPDLTHLMSRATIASGSLENNADNLKKWVENPDQFKPGVLMPSMHLSQPELEKITVYLTSLK